MGLSGGAFSAVISMGVVACLIYGFFLRTELLPRALARFFIQYAAYLYVRASKAVSSKIRSTSELPLSELHRRRDLIGGSAMLHEHPGVIPNYNSMLERMLNRYGRYLNVNAEIPDTNETVFRVRSWLRNCEKNHKGRDGNPHCQPLDEDGRGYPLWLIDIEQRCVVPFQANLSYFALSYVWGRVETAKMERSNLVQLQQPGSLLGSHQAVKLPRTIKDAMFLTGFLGHRYLWCDRLCLVQDDISSQLPQIQHMAEIYARAYCTIVAYDNLDANSGLHGLPILTRCSRRQVSTSAHTKPAHWSSRAWTFQEELFSVRIIQLSSHAVNWQCSPLRENKSTYGSNHRRDPNSIRSLQFFSDFSNSSRQVGGMFCPRHASMAYYIELAEDYSQRHVNEQHPEDKIHALASVQSILKASYPGAFIQGIPECLLVQCLLWNTSASRYKDFINPLTGMRASSWSWIGWSARIFYPKFADRRSRRCEGLVSWYVSLKKDSRRYPASVAKEEGWARHKKVEGRSSASIIPLNASSTGNLDISLGSQGFKHIIPLAVDSHEPSTLEVKNRCSFLHGRVLMARFRVQFWKLSEDLFPIHVLLCKRSRDYAGVLCGVSGSLEDGQVINLIAISQGSHQKWQCCQRHPSRPDLDPERSVYSIAFGNCSDMRYLFRDHPLREKSVYEFYDVLWVEYEDGVAYRKDLGRVRKDIWDRETLGWIDVTLG